MKNISEKKTIDVTGVNFSPIASFKQGDAGVLKLELFKNGEVFNITGQTVKLGAYRPNKTIVEQLDGFTINNNSLTISLKNNILAVHGIVEVDLTLTDSEGEMTTASFYLKVNKKVLGRDNIAASDEIDSLKQIKLDLTALNENVKREENTRVANEKNRVSEEKIRKVNETERINFYEGVAKQLVEDLSQYDKEIENIYHTIRENDYLPFEGENVTVEHSLTGMTKDMILEGRIYQNLIPKFTGTKEPYYTVDSNGVLTLKGNSSTHSQYVWLGNPIALFKPNTTYTLITNVLENSLNVDMNLMNHSSTFLAKTNIVLKAGFIGQIIKTFQTKESFEVSDRMGVIVSAGTTGSVKLTSYLILEGDYTNEYIPNYFEEIKSVGEDEGKLISLSKGKNLLNYLNPTFKNNAPSKFEITFEGNIIKMKNKTQEELANFYFGKVSGFIPGKRYVMSAVNGDGRLYAYKDKILGVRAGFVDLSSSRSGWFLATQTEYIIGLYIASTQKEVFFDSIMIEEVEEGTTTASEYVEYKEEKKEILLPIENGLKGFPNGTCDTIEIREDGIYFVKRINKVVLNGVESTWKLDSRLTTTARFYNNGLNNRMSSNAICDKFKFVPNSYSLDEEHVYFSSGKDGLYIFIDKIKLETQDIEGLKKWLQANPITIYYELAKPIEIKLDIPSLNMKTFNEVTHIYFENSISPHAKFKAPVNVPATISTLRTRNESLEQENKELKEEVSVKTLKLHGQDVELTNSDLDLDFRIFELEMSIGLPINLNMKGMRNMARSPFEMMKILVLNNNYDREDIEYKASRYLQGKRMTQVEYDEIISLMDANELVK